MERKGFGIRLAAYLIDMVIMFLVIGGLATLLIAGTFSVGMGTPNTAGGQAAAEGAFRIAGLVAGLLGLAYASLEIFMAQSVGKMLLKIKIADQSGSPATMNQTRSSPHASRHCSARIRWPRWIGSNVPPKSPSLMEASNLSGARPSWTCVQNGV